MVHPSPAIAMEHEISSMVRIRAASSVGLSSPLRYIISGFGIVDGLPGPWNAGYYWILMVNPSPLGQALRPRCALIPAFGYVWGP